MPLSYKEYIDRRLEGKRKIHDVPAGLDLNGLLVEKLRPLWIGAGRLESGYLPQSAQRQEIENPVYVCGLARAGTTLLLEAIFRTGAFAAHSYRLYPFIDIPVVWERWTRLPAGAKTPPPQERGHLDLLDVTFDSPEAVEEMIWMYFFPRAHDPAVSNELDATIRNPSFAAYYASHIRKIMHIFGKQRYLAKGNYNLTRIPYILSLFPDARFVIPVRRAEAHIASLMKQHYLFTRLEQDDPRALRYMNRVGHFEFGL
ncbi:MAG TPA: sulfotransferase, partial [Patescibacteria group bacterium]|nr:sulfotransferase [Patescibacteria group bacterium]